MLPIYIRNSRSLNVFEHRLELHFPPPIKMPWFSVGERFVNIHHTRIRIGCSKLKGHLHFNLHVEDDPSCRCGFGIEDPYHFLFTCPLYAQIRVVTGFPQGLENRENRGKIMFRKSPGIFILGQKSGIFFADCHDNLLFFLSIIEKVCPGIHQYESAHVTLQEMLHQQH